MAGDKNHGHEHQLEAQVVQELEHKRMRVTLSPVKSRNEIVSLEYWENVSLDDTVKRTKKIRSIIRLHALFNSIVE